MTFLDDLFSAALQQQQTPGTASVHINASVAFSPSSDSVNESSVPTPVRFGYAKLTYFPSQEQRIGRYGWRMFPPYFEGSLYAYTEAFTVFEGAQGIVNQSPGWMGLVIAAPPIVFIGTSNYEISVSGSEEGSGRSFVPSIDPTTNVVYGAAGAEFVVVSLSGPTPAPQPPH